MAHWVGELLAVREELPVTDRVLVAVPHREGLPEGEGLLVAEMQALLLPEREALTQPEGVRVPLPQTDAVMLVVRVSETVTVMVGVTETE